METIKPAFHHVTLKTSQLQEMIGWYRVLIGVEVNFQDENNAWTTNDEANHHIAFLSVPGLEQDANKVKHTGIHHSAFEYGSFDDLMSSYERLKGEGILPAFSLDLGIGPDKVGQPAIQAWTAERAAMTDRRSRHVQSNLQLVAVSPEECRGTVVLTLHRHDGSARADLAPLMVAE